MTWSGAAFSAVIALVGCVYANEVQAQTRPGVLRVRVPQDVRSIQAAVDVVADRDTILIAPGTYFETLDIVGKHVNLIGLGPRAERRTESVAGPVLVGPAPQAGLRTTLGRGIVNIGPGGGARLEHFVLFGGDAAVVGRSDDRGESPSLELERVSMLRNGRGVAGKFGRVALHQVRITGSIMQGLALNCFRQLEIFNSFVANAQEVGLHIVSCTEFPIVEIKNTPLSFNLGGGAVFVGSMILTIENVMFDSNHAFGILLVNVPLSTIENTTVQGTIQAQTPYWGEMADGIDALDSTAVQLRSSQILGNARAGVILAGSNAPTTGTLLDTTITANRVGLVVQDAAAWVDLGNNSIAGNLEQDTSEPANGSLPVPGPLPIPES
jgi:hypothetical protein